MVHPSLREGPLSAITATVHTSPRTSEKMQEKDRFDVNLTNPPEVADPPVRSIGWRSWTT